MTRRAEQYVPEIVTCPGCEHRMVRHLPHSDFGHPCPAIRGGDKWRWYLPRPTQEEGE